MGAGLSIPFAIETPVIDNDGYGLMSDAGLLCVLSRNPLFAGLSRCVLEALLPALQPVVRHYKKNNVILSEGDAMALVGYLLEGRMFAQKLSSGGRAHILSMYEEGQSFGFDAVFSSFGTSPLTFVAETDCTTLFLSLDFLFAQPTETGLQILRNIGRVLADDSVRLLYKTDILSKSSLRERILSYFAILEQKSHGGPFSLRMTREQFAQYLCVNRSALSRELNRMQKEGLIETRANGKMRVKHVL